MKTASTAMIISSLFLFGLQCTDCYATGINFSGHIATNTTWNTDSVNVFDTVIVDDNVTLTIEPGVMIRFYGESEMRIKGRLLALGTETDSIRFLPNSSSVQWNGLYFDSISAANDSSVLDYCLIKKCNIGGNLSHLLGGGLYVAHFSKLRVSHSLICSTDGSGVIMGGGVYCYNANPLFENTSIEGNRIHGTGRGAGVGLVDAHPTFVNCVIAGNRMDGSGSAAGMACVRSNPLLINTLISNNRCYGSTASGAAMVCDSSSPILVNSTIAGNTTGGASAMNSGVSCRYHSSPTFINTIMYDNFNSWLDRPEQVGISDTFCAPEFYYCNIQGGLSSFVTFVSFKGEYENNIDVDPKFAADSTGNFELADGSPCINAGMPDTTGLRLPELDLAGNPRIYNGIRVDMGAYEFQGAAGVLRPAKWPPQFNGPTVWLKDRRTMQVNPSIKKRATIDLFDCFGRRIQTIQKDFSKAGSHIIQFNPIIGSIPICCLLRTDQSIVAVKAIRLR